MLVNSIAARSINDVLWHLKDATSYLEKSSSDVYMRITRCKNAIRNYKLAATSSQHNRIDAGSELLNTVVLTNISDTYFVDVTLGKVWDIFTSLKQENSKSYIT